jgi:hypothetical protein
MIVLDENFDLVQRDQLRQWQIRARQIGDDVGRKGLRDTEVVALLRRGRCLTFITEDRDYFRSDWRHARCCLVFLDVPKGQEVLYVRRLVRHPRFDAEAKRLRHVIRVNQTHGRPGGSAVVVISDGGQGNPE